MEPNATHYQRQVLVQSKLGSNRKSEQSKQGLSCKSGPTLLWSAMSKLDLSYSLKLNRSHSTPKIEPALSKLL